MTDGLFKKALTPKFHDADPAGIMFFGNVYAKAHGIYEEFVGHLGFTWREWFDNGTWAVPIRHSECEHLAPIFPGMEYQVSCVLDKIGTSSFTMKYIFASAKATHAEVTIVHAFVDPVKKVKCEMPSIVRERLEAYKLKSGASK
jgi:acyl-CoA thioesterase FadM